MNVYLCVIQQHWIKHYFFLSFCLSSRWVTLRASAKQTIAQNQQNKNQHFDFDLFFSVICMCVFIVHPDKYDTRTFHFCLYVASNEHIAEFCQLTDVVHLKKINTSFDFFLGRWRQHICPRSRPAGNRLSCVGPHTARQLHSQTQSVDGETEHQKCKEALKNADKL